MVKRVRALPVPERCRTRVAGRAVSEDVSFRRLAPVLPADTIPEIVGETTGLGPQAFVERPRDCRWRALIADRKEIYTATFNGEALARHI